MIKDFRSLYIIPKGESSSARWPVAGGQTHHIFEKTQRFAKLRTFLDTKMYSFLHWQKIWKLQAFLLLHWNLLDQKSCLVHILSNFLRGSHRNYTDYVQNSCRMYTRRFFPNWKVPDPPIRHPPIRSPPPWYSIAWLGPRGIYEILELALRSVSAKDVSIKRGRLNILRLIDALYQPL